MNSEPRLKREDEKDHASRRQTMRWGLGLLGFVLAAAFLVHLYGDLDLRRFADVLASAEPSWLLLLAAGILLEQLVRGWKWRQILYDLKPIPSSRIFGAILAGYGVGILVPLGVSPIVRSWVVARREGLGTGTVLATAAIERFVDGVVFACLVLLVATFARFPDIEGNLRLGLAVAGALNLTLFAVLLSALFVGRRAIAPSRATSESLAQHLPGRWAEAFANARAAIAQGIVWPSDVSRQFGVVAASVVIKAIGATHLVWAGLAFGVRLGAGDYLFAFVVAGFALVLARFVRVPGGFVIGSGYALHVLGVADEEALSMILATNILTVALMVGPGLFVIWRSGLATAFLRAR